jgi:nicotinamide mononucleotide (NMN) deamidase PncC
MPTSVEELIEAIHRTPTRLLLAVSGGGSRAIAELLERPGASRTLLEAIVPYSEAAMIAYLGGRPDQFCAPETARAMAAAAWHRARKYEAATARLAGVACTAGLATDRPRRGPHHAHVAVQTAARTATWSLQLEKGRRSRADEEHLVARMVLGALADACGLGTVPIFGAEGHKNGTVPFGGWLPLGLDLAPGEEVQYAETLAPRRWQDLMTGRAAAVCHQGDDSAAAAVFPGAFHPLHAGHRQMIQIARRILGVPVAVEISILNVDKPPLDYMEIARRVAQFPPQQTVWLTQAATFAEKSRRFPRAVFVVGADTLRRIVAWEYYGGDRRACLAALEDIAARGCRFLVFGRTIGNRLMRLADLELPDFFRDTCQEVPPEQFRQDVSSRAIRGSGRSC